MKRHNWLFYIQLSIVFILIAGSVIYFYAAKLRSVLETNILMTIQETALHDRRAIHAILELFMDELAGVAARLKTPSPDSMRTVETRLNLERASTSFSNLYLLAKDGKIYTDKYIVYDPERGNLAGRIDLRSFFSENGDRFVTRFDDRAEFAGIARESILYGIRLRDFTVAGVEMTGIAGITDLKFLQEHMIIESFFVEGVPHGVSALIDASGSYIFGSVRDIYLGNDKNFFSRITGAARSTLDRKQISRKMRMRESFSFYMGAGDSRALYYLTPFSEKDGENAGWYLATSVNDKVIEGRQRVLLQMGLSLLGVVGLLIFVLLFIAMRATRNLYQAREAVKIRSEFLSNMSHEIRTPLNALIGLNYLVSSHIGDESKLPRLRDWLEKSKTVANYLLSLLNDILDMSKLQSGKVDLEESRFSIPAMLEDIWFMQGPGAEKKGIRFKIEQNLGWPWVIGDEIRTKQILTNIVGNAAKFTPEDGSITLSVSQSGEKAGKTVTTYICADTGAGMSQEFLKTIFDPFSQERNRNARNALKGTGLGMPICKELVDAMRGKISVDSELGKGSTFIVSLPTPIADALAGPGAETGEAASGPDGEKPKILLAEDAEFNAEFLMEALNDQGFEVERARNGQEAVDIFKNSQIGEFGIILMDMRMPEMDGCEAAALIRKLDREDAKDIVIYACTANTFREDRDRAMASGMNGFLTKPINLKIFLEKLRSHPSGESPSKSTRAEKEL